MKYVLIILFAGVLYAQGNYVPPTNSPLANHQHPRIFTTAEKLPELRSYIKRYEAANFQMLINEMDKAFNEPIAEKKRNYMLLDGMNYAFLYLLDPALMTGFRYGHRREAYAGKAYAHAEEIFKQNWLDEHNSGIWRSTDDGGYVNASLAAIYDWMYDWLSLAQKRAIADKLYDQFQRRFGSAHIGRQPFISNDVINQAHNGAFGGLAFYGDPLGAQYQSRAQEMLNYMRDTYIERFYETSEYIYEGRSGWGEGPSYMYLGMIAVNLFSSAYATATGVNVFHKYGILREHPYFLYFSINPSPQRDREKRLVYYTSRDNAVSLTSVGASYAYMLIPEIYNLKHSDPEIASFGKWLIREAGYPISEHYVDTMPRIFFTLHKFLWGSEDVQPRSPDALGVPLARRFGFETIIRGRHQQPPKSSDSATRVTFYHYKYFYFPHKSMDQSMFIVEKYGNLLLDAGTLKGNSDIPRSYRSGSAVFENVMGVYDPNDESEDNSLYKYQYQLKGKGDHYADPELQPGGAYDIGTTKAHDLRNGEYAYINYDYSRSNREGNAKMTAANRELVFFYSDRPQDDNDEYLVTYDRVTARQAHFRKRYLLQPAYPPTLESGEWTAQPNHVYIASQPGAIINITNTFQSSHGRMFVKALEPRNAIIRMIGDEPNFWFLGAEGKRNFIREKSPFDDWAAWHVSSRRIEIEAPGDNLEEDFLTVMQIGDSYSLKEMAPAERLETATHIGALINQDHLVWFSKDDNLHAALGYRLPAGGSVEHLVTGLRDGRYAITCDGQPVGRQEVTGSTLFFRHNGGGAFQIMKE